MDVQYCGSYHRLHAKLDRFPQHLPSPHPAKWNPVISTRCSTDARKAVPIKPIQPEMTEIKEPTDSTRVYSLSSTAKRPCQKVVLTVSNNNTQLIDLISHRTKDMLNDKLVSTGKYSFPIQIKKGVVFERYDMTITHEEADTLIIHQMAYVGTPL